MPSTSTVAVRTVLVTGASSGIGRAVALAAAARGDRVVLVARRRAELDEAAALCLLRGAAGAAVFLADVSRAEDCDAVLDAATAEVGAVDVVVHAAAVAAYGRFTDVPREVFDRVQAVNLLGTANVARAALRHFGERGRGHLVLFGSLLGKVSAPTMSPYVASKWAVHGLARTLQSELSGTDVHVSLVEPGGVATSIYTKAASYLGVQGKPPPPVYGAERVAGIVLRLLDHPRRERNAGVLNPLLVLGFRLVPAAYDRIVGPLMSRLALADEPVADHPGNLFQTCPEPIPSKGRR